MALDIEIPGLGELHLEHLVMDLNGTLAVDGKPAAGVGAALSALKDTLQLHLLTANTFGTAHELFGEHVAVTTLQPGDEAGQKRRFVAQLGTERCAALGNGANDALMLADATLGIVVMNPEGVAKVAWQAADIMTDSTLHALELFLHPARIKASLRR